MPALIWLGAFIFVSNALGDIYIEDSLAQAESKVARKFWTTASATTVCLVLPISCWLAGFTFRSSRLLSTITMLANTALIALLLWWIVHI